MARLALIVTARRPSRIPDALDTAGAANIDLLPRTSSATSTCAAAAPENTDQSWMGGLHGATHRSCR
jgi:hypothetical protein